MVFKKRVEDLAVNTSESTPDIRTLQRHPAPFHSLFVFVCLLVCGYYLNKNGFNKTRCHRSIMPTESQHGIFFHLIDLGHCMLYFNKLWHFIILNNIFGGDQSHPRSGWKICFKTEPETDENHDTYMFASFLGLIRFTTSPSLICHAAIKWHLSGRNQTTLALAHSCEFNVVNK